MIVAGLDVAFNNAGVAIFDDERQEPIHIALSQRSKEKNTRLNDMARAIEIRSFVLSLFRRFAVQEYAFEIPSGSKSARAAWTLGVALGVTATLSEQVSAVRAMDAKLALTGNKNAAKQEMIVSAVNLYPDLGWFTYKRKGEVFYSEKNEHMADAIGVALHRYGGTK